MSDYYASEVFPWADIDPAITLHGTLAHRRTTFRREWGRVLAGTDAEIAEALTALAAPTLRMLGLSDEMIPHFLLGEIHAGRIEDVIGPHRAGDQTIDRAKAFRAGWLARP